MNSFITPQDRINAPGSSSNEEQRDIASYPIATHIPKSLVERIEQPTLSVQAQPITNFNHVSEESVDLSGIVTEIWVNTGKGTNDPTRLFKYENCSKRLLKDYDIKIHMRTHTGERPYECQLSGCNERLTVSSNV
ncbi:hypothetical protein M422DRAFT_260204 [Sphaerobolus stellatus SS14]|uniref:C2H2-type domain-containing protein n=1 Tax=Sphaerobolus stellatus (strain SS14) TaxID=990650 RepID=A0A0C9UR69_SPHS4|nr:hypothetical protein M422DRAFT_260204 [Sphaerobolus stellatus SS14]